MFVKVGDTVAKALEIRVRLYSTKSFKSLGTLAYHKDNCHALAFASTFRDRERGGN